MGLAITAAARADDTGVVRISDRTAQPVVRAQSPDGPLVIPANCQTGVCDTYGGGACNPSCPPHGICGPSHGLVIGTSPTGYDGDWEGFEHYYGGSSECEDGELIDCPHCHPGQNCPHCGNLGYTHGGLSATRKGGNILVDGFATLCDKILGGIHDRLGLAESGGNGAGVPLMGHYAITYPVDPNYFDGRDGQVYAAQGYAGPVSVPLAPIVRHTYNYGWGIPSSRLTPISHPIPPSP